jgi:hypothetical protein
MLPAFEFEDAHVVLAALVIFVAIMYWHGREPGEHREKRWGVVLVGILVISIGYFKPAKYNWIHWLGHVGGFVVISWLIARSAKGSRP